MSPNSVCICLLFPNNSELLQSIDAVHENILCAYISFALNSQPVSFEVLTLKIHKGDFYLNFEKKKFSRASLIDLIFDSSIECIGQNWPRISILFYEGESQITCLH